MRRVLIAAVITLALPDLPSPEQVSAEPVRLLQVLRQHELLVVRHRQVRLRVAAAGGADDHAVLGAVQGPLAIRALQAEADPLGDDERDHRGDEDGRHRR